eukprot:1187765-Prorocentrum_minimum.AAC.5
MTTKALFCAKRSRPTSESWSPPERSRRSRRLVEVASAAKTWSVTCGHFPRSRQLEAPTGASASIRLDTALACMPSERRCSWLS